jgi:hypothetical protein
VANPKSGASADNLGNKSPFSLGFRFQGAFGPINVSGGLR